MNDFWLAVFQKHNRLVALLGISRILSHCSHSFFFDLGGFWFQKIAKASSNLFIFNMWSQNHGIFSCYDREHRYEVVKVTGGYQFISHALVKRHHTKCIRTWLEPSPCPLLYLDQAKRGRWRDRVQAFGNEPDWTESTVHHWLSPWSDMNQTEQFTSIHINCRYTEHNTRSIARQVANWGNKEGGTKIEEGSRSAELIWWGWVNSRYAVETCRSVDPRLRRVEISIHGSTHFVKMYGI